MKKSIFLFIACCLFGSLAYSQEIAIVGTGAGMDLLEAVVAEYQKLVPTAKITVPPSIGSGGGITVIGKDGALLGRVARQLKDTEKALGIQYVEFAKIPVVFYTHPSVGIKNLTRQQILDIFSGKIDNWKAIGGPDLAIKLVKRPKGDSSLDVLQASMKDFIGEHISADASTQFTDQKALQYVETNPGAIAFGTLADAAKAAVKYLSVDGIAPLDSGYNFIGTLALIYKDANLKGEVKSFVEYATSVKASAIIKAAFGIPIK